MRTQAIFHHIQTYDIFPSLQGAGSLLTGYFVIQILSSQGMNHTFIANFIIQ